MNGQTAQERFISAAKSGKVLSAYLITCSRINIALRLADDFLLHLFCTYGGCGKCTDCLKVMRGHIDILRLCAPKVEEIRDAIAFVAEKAYEADYKAIIIENADSMTPQAANSLLKTLEEPPHSTVFVLTARSVSGVLPTIASRCATISISPSKGAPEKMAESLGCDINTAAILCDLAGGYEDEARRILNDKQLIMRREETLAMLHGLLMQKNMAISAFADYLEQYKENISDLLGIMLSYLRDIRLYKKLRDERMIINRDRLDYIRQAAYIFTSGAIRNMINVILETGKRFFAAVNFRLTVEKMLFCILEEKNKCIKL